MTPEQINIECALVDGWEIHEPTSETGDVELWIKEGEFDQFLPGTEEEKEVFSKYTTSYDAIIPLIQRQLFATEGEGDEKIQLKPDELVDFWEELDELTSFFDEWGHVGMLNCTPLQLATALLKALGRWKE